ncbi:MAG: PAS domain S-box protein [Syntrophobacteraceae bacterium]
MNKSTQWALIFLLITIVGLLAGGAWFYRVQEQAVLRTVETGLSRVGRLKAEEIAAWREKLLKNASMLQGEPALVGFLSNSDSRDEMQRFRAQMNFVARAFECDQILLVAPDGRMRFSLRGRNELYGKEAQTVRSALREGRCELSDLYVNSQNHAICISTVAPLFDGVGAYAKPVGAIVLVYDASRLLFPVVRSWPVRTKTAESVLVEREGEGVLFLSDLRYRSAAPLTLRTPLSRAHAPEVMAIKGRTGVFSGIDYRGEKVLSAALHVSGSPWYLLAKIDAPEALAEWQVRSLHILLLLACLLTISFLLGGVLFVLEKKNNYRSLYRSEKALRQITERHSVTLQSIGDAVIATDELGRIELLNAVAEELTGWSNDEAKGLPVEEVFRIVNEKTRETVASPVARVLEEGNVVGLANHTLLISRDGAERPIADSGAPIRSEDGTLLGVVLVFRDQSSERRAQRLTSIRLDLIEYAAVHSLDEFLAEAVDQVCACMNSPIGYYHFVESDQKTLSLQQFSTRTLDEFCQIPEKGMHYSIDRAGVWVDCVREKKPVIHNDYDSLEQKRGIPEGHVRVVRDLAVPVIRDGELVAIMGVGNKPGNYTATDSETASYLADVVWEIVSRKQTDEARLKTETINTAIINQAAESIVLSDAETLRFVEFNDATCHGLGYSREEFAELTLQDIQGILTREEALQRVNDIQQKGHMRWENRYRCKDGSFRDFLVSSRAITIGDRKYLLGVWLDITERKRMEGTLRDSELKFKTILQTTNEGFWLVDNDAVIRDVNPRLCEILGREREKILGRKFSCFVDEENGLILNRQLDLREKGLPGVYEIAFLRPDGSHIFCRNSGTTFFDGAGQKIGAFGMITDISEQKKLEARIRQSQKIEAIGTLAGGIAHDFNNILGIIVGYAELAQLKVPDDSKAFRNLEEILKAADRAKGLVRQILTFSRMGGQENQPVQVGLIVKEALKMLRSTLPSTIEIRQWVASNSLVLGNSTQIHQVLLNLCTNAFHAMKETGGVLEVSLLDVEVDEETAGRNPGMRPGPCLKLSVSDTGYGMDEGVLDRIFDPYFTTKSKDEGTGLGLSVVHGIVHSHGGFITVVSRVGEGSTFEVFFPRFSITKGAPRDVGLPGAIGAGTERILLVDDEEDLCRSYKEILEILGYRVVTKTSSIEAMEVFLVDPSNFDLVITDQTMPKMTGTELAGQIRRLRPDIPIILCTGYSQAVENEQPGISTLLMKPISKDHLVSAIRKILDGRRGL